MLAAVLILAAVATTAAGAAAPAAADPEHAAAPAATLEGRPPAAETVAPGIYRGDLVIDRPLRLVGVGQPRLAGSGKGSVVRVRADDVTVEGFAIDGLGGGSLMRDSSGVHVAGRRVVLRDLRISGSLFGIYLREADDATVERCVVQGIPGKTPGEKGSGIHLWNTRGFRLAGNEVVDVRDGVYIQSSSGGTIIGNTARDLRYGLHYMYSDDNLFEDNTFANGAAGTAIMYSRRIVFRRNRFLHNRGFASVGLLLKTCDDVIAEDNLIADNARGLFLEGSNGNTIRGNVIAASDMAIVLYDSCANNRITGNSFVGNMTPLFLVGRRTDTVFEGNYWSGNDEPDLDGDGFSDRPYRLANVFDHLRGNLIAADLMAQGTAALALGAAEETFPVLQPIAAVDPRPLVRPPRLPEVPAADLQGGRPRWFAMAGSALVLAAGVAVIAGGGRRPKAPAEVRR
jgi:nitrous oxidase accessory protein